MCVCVYIYMSACVCLLSPLHEQVAIRRPIYKRGLTGLKPKSSVSSTACNIKVK